MNRDVVKLLCFELAGRVFAIDIMGIQEILRKVNVTPLPGAASPVAGVTNLRGKLLPVLDPSSLLLRKSREELPADSKLLVVRSTRQTAGILVDQVLDVVSMKVEDLSPVPGPTADGIAVAAFRRELEGKGPVVVLLLRLKRLLDAVAPDRPGALP